MSRTEQRILVVDDQADIRELLKYNLSNEGFDVKVASDGIIGVEIAKEFNPQLILMDIMMPNQDGVETCRQIRAIPELVNVFVIFLTARSEEYSEIAAFDSGADDYITKPIKPRALISRINAFFRRSKTETKETDLLQTGDLIIDASGYTVTINDKSLNLPKKEFELLHYMAQRQGRVFNRESLIRSVWGTDVYVLNRTVDVHVRKVREKIGEGYIHTVKGVGYKFDPST
ncbi:MAG: response regulator transcription factor [Cytophagales bacterium]|nr:response regulator transcription factor [Cytophagales bacterium]